MDCSITAVALYEYSVELIEYGDSFTLEMGAEYEVLEAIYEENWCKVKDRNGSIGYVPRNYIKEKNNTGLQTHEWYVGKMSRERAESLLKHENKEGSFVVRDSSTKGLYALSLYTKEPHPYVEHYHIKQSSRGNFFLTKKHSFTTIPDLINDHKHSSGGLVTRLKTSPSTKRSQQHQVAQSFGFSRDGWEIDRTELKLLEELGAGSFGVVRRAKWRGSVDTAVKMIKEGCMSEADFIKEAKVMTYVLDEHYISTRGSIFATRWIPPEVLKYSRYSSKSDVWAFGVLMWEIFSCGKTPYGRLNESEVIKQVQKGSVLKKPEACYKEEYHVMKQCWHYSPEDRPSFRSLKKKLMVIDSLDQE